MQVIDGTLGGLKIIEPVVHSDERGFFFESFQVQRYAELAGISATFVQENHSHSSRGVLRGLHYQLQHPQGKLVRVASGEIFDVAVDLRRSSASYGQWMGIVLSSSNRRQLWIPPGFAHGVFVLSASADLLYKTTDYYHADDEHCLSWQDPSVAIDWPFDDVSPIVSARDKDGKSLAQAPGFP
jgi:dTDP-4-dehydrorhamnose 3,5-epimerase